jgi:uncharacterized protein (DUF486 family)
MKNRYLIIVTLGSWGNIGLFYYLYANGMETILVGVLKELTLIPSYLCGIVFPVWFLIRALKNKP